MNSIRRIAKTAAAGLVGASLVGGAAAQSNSLDLGDYPAPFVDEDGEVNTAVVVGEQASTIDVVGAINIAGSLGQDAFSTEQVSVEGSSYGFTASQGTTLSTENDDLYFGDSLTEVRDTLTSEQLSTLEEVTFRDDSGDETDIEQYLYPASNAIKFGKPDERDDEDPVVYVENPEDPDNNDFLFRLQANFEDSLNFTSGDVQDEDLELFGNAYQVSSDSDSDEVVLNGARETVSVSTGNESSATVTVGGDEVTFEVVGVTDSDTAAISINGEIKEEDEDSDFTVNGENVRIDDIIQTNSDNSQGTVQLAVGSDQLVLQDGNTVQDEDGDDIEGLYSEFQGTPSSLGGIDLYVGAEDDDQTYVLEGESYTHPMFPDYAFRFGGLNPDTTSEDSGAEETEVSTSGDETVTVDLNQGGDSGSIEFINYDGSSQNLADDDGDAIKVVEGSNVQEDEYFVSDAGDFTHLWEVTSIDRDGTQGGSSEIEQSDSATIDLRDTVTGDDVEVDLDSVEGGDSTFGDGNEIYADTEVIDGQTYHFELEGADNSDPSFQYAYGTDAAVDSDSDVDVDTGSNADGATTAFTTIETGDGARISLYDPGQSPNGVALGTNLNDIETSDNLYFNDQGTTGDVDSGDSLWIDNGDDGIFNENGQIVSSDTPSGLSDIPDPEFDIELDAPSSDPADTTIQFGSSTDITNPKSQQETLGIQSSTNIADGAVATSGSQNFIVQSSTADGSSSTLTVIGDDGDTIDGDDLKGSTFNNQIPTGSRAGATDGDAVIDSDGATSFSPTGADTVAIDDGQGSGVDLSTVSSGDVLAVDTDGNDGIGDYASGGSVFLVADDGGSDQNGDAKNNLGVIARNGESISDGDDVFLVDSFSDGSNSADIDANFLDDPSDIESSISSALSSQGVSATVDLDYDGNNNLRIQSDDDSDTSFVEVFSSSGSGTSVETQLNLDSASESRRDRVQFGSGSVSDDTTTGSEVTASSFLKSPSDPFTDGDTIVEDEDSSGDFTRLDEVVGSSAGNIRYFSTDAEETDGATDGVFDSLPTSKPGLVFIEEEADDDSQYGYTVTASFDSGEEELQLDSPVYSDSNRQTSTLESNDDVAAGVDFFGTYTEFDDDEQGSFTLRYPDGQAVAGAGFTSTEGSLDTGGSGSTSVQRAAGFPESALLDSEVTQSQRTGTNHILVGGPAVNTLVSDLAEANETMTGSEYTEGDSMIQLVQGAFADGQSSLIVAGFSGEDTRQAANRLANADENPLPGQDQVMVGTGQ